MCAELVRRGQRFIDLIREDSKVLAFADVTTKAVLSSQLLLALIQLN